MMPGCIIDACQLTSLVSNPGESRPADVRDRIT
jgi:hypothetical protein